MHQKTNRLPIGYQSVTYHRLPLFIFSIYLLLLYYYYYYYYYYIKGNRLYSIIGYHGKIAAGRPPPIFIAATGNFAKNGYIGYLLIFSGYFLALKKTCFDPKKRAIYSRRRTYIKTPLFVGFSVLA